MEHVHKKNHREGVEYLKSIVQQRFWITGIRNCLRAIRHSCVQCRKLNAKPETPLMAGLPPERMAMKCYPFEYTGIDYFGPFEVRFLRRTLKRWCCILAGFCGTGTYISSVLFACCGFICFEIPVMLSEEISQYDLFTKVAVVVFLGCNHGLKNSFELALCFLRPID